MTFARALRSALLLMLFAWIASLQAAELPATVRDALDAAAIPAANVAVWVQPVDGDAPQLTANPDRPMNPASVMKLITTFAVLERFGPAHTWTTRVTTNGGVRGGVLDGDLFIVGGGDPMLTDERMWKLLRRVRALGIDTVRGDIVLDGSALRLPPHDPQAFDGRGLRPYNSAAHGLLLHFNTLQLALLPAAHAGEPVTVVANPPLQGLEIDNRLATADGDCDVWYANLDARLEAGAAGERVVLLGSLPARCGRRDWGVSPLAPERFAVAAVAGLWAETGGKVEGMVRPGSAPTDASPLLEETSPPLADVLREMNKWSSNVIARQLLASLGAGPEVATSVADRIEVGSAHALAGAEPKSAVEAGANEPADAATTTGATAPVETYGIRADAATVETHPIDMVAAGADAAHAQLAAAGIDTSRLVIANGSGLSRIESVTARTLGEMLLAAWRRPYMPEFIASLPIIGVDGTLRDRLATSPASGHAHLKTGYINGVRAIAGYVLDRNGRRHVVAMLVNDPRAVDSRPALDALIEWVWRGDAELASREAPVTPLDGKTQ